MYLLLSLVLFLTPLLLASSLPSPSNPNAIPGKYIVQLQPSTSVSSLAAHHSIVRRLARRHEAHEPIERVFSIGTLNAYLGDFDADAVAQVEALEEVASVEADEYIYLENTNPPIPNEKNQEKRALITETNSLWSLADLSHAEAGATSYVYDDSAGAGMTAYVFDTGIRLSHEQFEGRARFGINAILNSTDPAEAGNDQDGHGTHCAATIVGKTFGVARKAEVVDVKVFDGAVVRPPPLSPLTH
jgi:oryzin